MHLRQRLLLHHLRADAYYRHGLLHLQEALAAQHKLLRHHRLALGKITKISSMFRYVDSMLLFFLK